MGMLGTERIEQGRSTSRQSHPLRTRAMKCTIPLASPLPFSYLSVSPSLTLPTAPPSCTFLHIPTLFPPLRFHTPPRTCTLPSLLPSFPSPLPTLSLPLSLPLLCLPPRFPAPPRTFTHLHPPTNSISYHHAPRHTRGEARSTYKRRRREERMVRLFTTEMGEWLWGKSVSKTRGWE